MWFYFLFICLFFFWPCGLWNFSSPTRNGTRASAVKVPSPNHWTVREFPEVLCTSIKIEPREQLIRMDREWYYISSLPFIIVTLFSFSNDEQEFSFEAKSGSCVLILSIGNRLHFCLGELRLINVALSFL